MMSRQTGLNLEKETHQISQAIQDILTTPIGSRVMRRTYGSLLPKMIDAPFNEITRLQLYAATATALIQWENRINLESISIDILDQGKFILDLKVIVVDSNQNESLSIPLNFGAIS
ncbi:Phage baseplate assembly protein [Acinetobacter lwoffii]|uniref:GPW/gp25 family protein n=1 Tax=Acinetobacter lwoffii TaxID=28090 RepID=UPI001C9318EA|nr:GPW/gp25 family protein [Acinetobacter lwoffii]QZD32091.1 Phage baseplate assembly protein [Acinetobacter lwoffii]